MLQCLDLIGCQRIAGLGWWHPIFIISRDSKQQQAFIRMVRVDRPAGVACRNSVVASIKPEVCLACVPVGAMACEAVVRENWQYVIVEINTLVDGSIDRGQGCQRYQPGDEWSDNDLETMFHRIESRMPCGWLQVLTVGKGAIT